ncbi:MAG: Holliday junction branch migration protein RuvA [Actinobacteria bacterium]|nr:Holliday junction branch migration protein RuvA [Actinomycetota bacterium]
MIATLTGRIAEKSQSWAIIEVGGVGYRMAMSARSLASLPAPDEEVRIHTFLQVRDDDLSLFGFTDPIEKEIFERLITVSGVGPKVALSALSSYAPERLIAAILAEDVTAVCEIPGIGKKTAQRIIIELKDKFGPGSEIASLPVGTGAPSSAGGEVREALLAMGFSATEVHRAIAEYEGEADVALMLRETLRMLGGGTR